MWTYTRYVLNAEAQVPIISTSNGESNNPGTGINANVGDANEESSWNFAYCPSDENLNQAWFQNGFSHCFLETVVDSISLSFALLFGITQLLFYRKYGTAVKHYVLPYSQLFGLQMVLNGIMPLLAFIHFILDISTPEEEAETGSRPGSGSSFFGYMILSLLQGFIVWPMICILILQERNNMLPTVPRKGHGLILLILWTWTFASENLAFLNILSPNWFFAFRNAADVVRFCLFLVEYATTAMILILGIRAPGIPSFQNSDSFLRLVSNEYVSYSAVEKQKAAAGSDQGAVDLDNGTATDSTSSGEEDPQGYGPGATAALAKGAESGTGSGTGHLDNPTSIKK